jgi:hypothetical protein
VVERDPCHSRPKCTRLYDEQVPVACFRQGSAEIIRFTKRRDCVGGHFAIDAKYLMPILAMQIWQECGKAVGNPDRTGTRAT